MFSGSHSNKNNESLKSESCCTSVNVQNIEEAFCKSLLIVATQFKEKMGLPSELVDKCKELYGRYCTEVKGITPGFALPHHGQMRI